MARPQWWRHSAVALSVAALCARTLALHCFAGPRCNAEQLHVVQHWTPVPREGLGLAPGVQRPHNFHSPQPHLRRLQVSAEPADAVTADAEQSETNSVIQRLADRFQKIAGVAFFIAVDYRLKAAGISTPIAGMLGVFAILLGLEVTVGTGVAKTCFRALEPGYRFLVKWATLFFVPALVKLPLVNEALSGWTLFCLAVLLVVGFIGTLTSTAGIASLFPAVESPKTDSPKPAANSTQTRPYPRPGAPYKKRWLPAYISGMVVSVMAAKFGFMPIAAGTLFMICASLLGFAAGMTAPKQVRAWFHPLFICVGVSWLGAAAWAWQAGPKIGFLQVLADYSAWPGAGALLSFMLGPAVVALSMLLFERRQLLRRELVPMLFTCIATSVVSLFGTAILARLLALPNMLAVASLSRCVTSAIALDIARTLGASETFAIAMVVISGFLGAAFGQGLFGLLRLKSARTRGLAMAASAHGLGTVSLAGTDEEALPYSAVGFALVGAASSALVQIPAIRSALFWILPG